MALRCDNNFVGLGWGKQFKRLVKTHTYSRPAGGHRWQAPGQWGHQECKDKRAERLGGQRETEVPQRCPVPAGTGQHSAKEHSKSRAVAQPQPPAHSTPAVSRKEEQSVRHYRHRLVTSLPSPHPKPPHQAHQELLSLCVQIWTSFLPFQTLNGSHFPKLAQARLGLP